MAFAFSCVPLLPKGLVHDLHGIAFTEITVHERACGSDSHGGARCLVVTCCSEETEYLSTGHGGLFREEGP